MNPSLWEETVKVVAGNPIGIVKNLIHMKPQKSDEMKIHSRQRSLNPWTTEYETSRLW